MSGGETPRLLTLEELPAIVQRMHRTLVAHRDEVDALNVFPVPDGDTGTNMASTARAALEALDDLEDGASAADGAAAIARGSLRGARGNSGVILSQVIRALVTVLTDQGELQADGLATMLEHARELAYDAVADPVEGTILTTITHAAIRARRCAQEERDLGETLDEVLGDVESTTEDTLQMLQANRDAGVVDAGARGFALVVGALHAHVTGVPADPPPVAARKFERPDPVVPTHESGSLEFRFEVQYLLDASEEVTAPLRSRLRELGDSVTVVASAGTVAVHVHTNEVGRAIEVGLEQGPVSEISVVYFEDQIRSAADGESADLGCVAVLPAGRLPALARDHDVEPVPGTAGHLPSVDDLLRGIRNASARRVFLLPGNRNVIPTARQARDVAADEGIGKLDIISGAVTVPAVIAALAVFDPDAEADVVLADMEEAAGAVRTGEVVAAVRDASTPIGQVRQGQFLTIVEDDVVAVGDDPLDALKTLVDHYADEAVELVTLIVGAEVADDERERAVVTLREGLEGVEIEIVDGEQRPARYLVGVE